MAGHESLYSQRESGGDEAPPTPSDEGTASTREQELEEPKASLVTGIRRFFLDSIRSKAVVPALLVSTLLSFSIGLTVGIVPEVLTDRYARLYHGYGAGAGIVIQDDGGSGSGSGSFGGSLQLPPPCWDFETSTMPEACIQGADDAQTGSAYGTLVQNLLTFFFNASIGSYSDANGRRVPLLVCLFINTLVPASLVAMELVEGMAPFWFYAANAVTGVVSYPSLLFAMLSDNCPDEHRAGRFSMVLAGFYLGFAIAPTLAIYTSHIVASWWSLALSVLTLVVSIVFLPETLPESVAMAARNLNNASANSLEDATSVVENSLQQQQQQQQQQLPQSQTMVASQASALSQGEEEENHERCSSEPESHSIERSFSPRPSGCWQSTAALLTRPLQEMAILTRDPVLQLVALSSFLSAAVYSTDASLVIFYIEEHLNVRETDIASMFFVMGILGAILQGIGLQPLVYCLGEKGLLVVSFVSGTLHNLLYGIASNKTEITWALSLSQLTKLGYPLLSSLASQQVGLDEQGRVQGALLALNALAGAVGPVSMNWIYERTKSGTKYFGPGTMFLLASGLYLLGTAVVVFLPSKSTPAATAAAAATDDGNSNNVSNCNSNSNASACETDETAGSSLHWEGGDLEEPLLRQLGDTITI